MSDDETPSDKVRKAMANKRPLPEKPALKVVGGTDQPSDKPKRTRKPKASAPAGDGEPVHEAGAPADIDAAGGSRASTEERQLALRCADYDQNDRGNAWRLVEWYGPQLCYVVGPGWLAWQGTHWLRDEADLAVRFWAQEIVDKIKLEVVEIEANPAQAALLGLAAKVDKTKPWSELGSEDQKLLKRAEGVEKSLLEKKSKRRAWAVTSGNAGRTAAMLDQAKSLKATPIEALDADHMRFNLKNGTLVFARDLDPERPEGSNRKVGTVEFLPHSRTDLITKLADVAYDAEATCPFFLETFLAKVQPDAAMRRFLQVSTAYALLLGGNDQQRLFFHYGTGANGKSAFFELIGRLAGSYRQIASPETITGDSQRAGQQANPDIARLHNARLVTIEELPKNTPLREELIKALTGGTKILARFLNKEFFEFMPIFTPMLNGNSKPAIVGTDYGIWRRVLLILWGVTLTEEEKIEPTELAAKLDAERAGILNWLIEGLLLYLANGLDPYIPAEVKAFTQDYREERDNVGVFVDVAIERVEGQHIKAGDLYKAYAKWCGVNELRPVSQRAFGDAMTEKGFQKKRSSIYLYLDVKLRDLSEVLGSDGHGHDYGEPPARNPDDPGFDPMA
jgi:putative DNA primase/helicase